LVLVQQPLDTKEAKNQVSKKASLPHTPVLQIGQNHGLQNLAPTSFALIPSFRQVLLCPYSPPANPFCPISSKAFLLTLGITIPVKQKSPASLTYKAFVICTSAYPRICASKITSSSCQ
jgi:hypothetical protein